MVILFSYVFLELSMPSIQILLLSVFFVAQCYQDFFYLQYFSLLLEWW